MTTMSQAAGPTLPRNEVEWDTVLTAKYEILNRDPLEIDHADYPQVRPEVVASWRRSMLADVDPHNRTYTGQDELQPRTRLSQAAQPIMERLKDEISDLNCWGFLADRACRLLTTAVGDFPEAARLHQQHLMPGMCFAEDTMGTNGLGCAHEMQRPFVISGTEHFRTDAEILTTTGVILRDPFTKRQVGSFGAHCMREYGSTALLSLAVEIGRSIEAQLLATRSSGERELFDAYLSAQRRYRWPVVALSRQLFVISTSARDVIHEADEELLRRLAEESGARTNTAHRQVSSGAMLTIQVLPVPRPRGEFAAILVLRPHELGTARPVRTASADLTITAIGYRESLDNALAGGLTVLLTGERGSGKSHLARAGLQHLGRARVVEFDGALAYLSPDVWIRELASEAADEDAAVVIRHVTAAPPELIPTMADILTAACAAVVGTTTNGSADDSAMVLVCESFRATLSVPPLRRRRDEFAAICQSLLDHLTPYRDQPVKLTARALAALVASDWPGNVRQLQQVLTSARIRVNGPAIDVRDLPTRHSRNVTSHPLNEVRDAERRIFEAALHEADGDCNRVAEKLHISRATVYRKIKRFDLNLTAKQDNSSQLGAN